MKKINPEVFMADSEIVRVSKEDIEFLKQRVKTSPRGRVRLCAHPENADPLHEMFIVLSEETYIRPHRHFNKSESFHILEGAADIVLFDEQGDIEQVIPMGNIASGKQFYYRMSAPRYHTVLIHTGPLIVHETTNGPFRPGDAEFASWAPDENNSKASSEFKAALADRARQFMVGKANKRA